MNQSSVRQAEFADLGAVAVLFDLHRQAQGQASDLAGAQAFLKARFDNGESVVFVAQQGQRVLGFAQLYPSFSSTALARVLVLNDLFVHEAGRRQGLASALLAAVEAHAWSLGAVRLTLNVARDNLAGQALYRARGWHQDAQFWMFHRFPDPS